jgi:N-formylglutamate amidohydrolase
METNWLADVIILHLPHASTVLPKEIEFLLDDEALAYEVDSMTDHSTDRLFDLLGAHRCIFPVSRLVVDPERFLADKMESVGMGAVYTSTSNGQRLRTISDEERLELIDTYYHPHHAKLTRMVDDQLEQHGRCLIIDCHSFPAQPLPYELDRNRPDICIGTDTYHTSAKLKNCLSKAFEASGYCVAIDSPFSGSIVPLKHHHLDPRVSSVMIEVNRSLYDSPSGFKRIQSDLSHAISQAATIGPYHNPGE